jgi:SAM-dependent methyltransferase
LGRDGCRHLNVIMLRYIRLSTFYRLLPSVSRFFRQRRMAAFAQFLDQVGLQNPRILDVGGNTRIWENIEFPLNITILNLAKVLQENPSHHQITFVVGDGCDMAQFKDNQFDIVFSNSVIEHVGTQEKQVKFATEVLRVGRFFWVQTPSKWFPIEAHSGMPLWWFYPESLRKFFFRHWRQKELFNWTDMVEGTTYLERDDFKGLFPDSSLTTERLFGIPKSYTVFSNLAKKPA